jgi:hypothetical protein
MKTYGRVDAYIHVFLTSALVGGVWSASRPGRFTSGERAPYILWIGSLDRRLGGPQYRSGRRGEEKNLATPGTRTPTSRASSPYPITTSTALLRLFTLKRLIKPELSFYYITLSVLWNGNLSVQYHFCWENKRWISIVFYIIEHFIFELFACRVVI